MGVVESSVTYQLNFEPDYRIATQALGDMGWDNPEAAGIPSLDEVEKGVRVGPLGPWLIERMAMGCDDKLLIVPRVGGEAGIGVSELIIRSDPKAFEEGRVWSPVWADENNRNPYGDMDPVHDNAELEGLPTGWDVGILLGDSNDPLTDRALLFTLGLVYNDKSVAQQQEDFLAEKKELAESGINIVTATVGHMAVDSAMLRANGEPQRSGHTRLIHCKPIAARQSMFRRRVPLSPTIQAHSASGRLVFDHTDAKQYGFHVGVRRVARVAIQD